MNKFEKIVYAKYLKIIRASVIGKYRKIAIIEANNKKIYLDKNNCSKQLSEIKKEIYNSYLPIIENEIEDRLKHIVESDKFKKAVEAEEQLSKKELHYKALKKYQKLPIHISEKFLDILFKEVNLDKSKKEISKDELRYLVLLIFYGIIDSIKEGYVIKIGTLFKIWCKKRDFVSNLPLDNRIKMDRLFPKLKLCSSFNHNLFTTINRNNEAIANYYKAKAERLLILLKIKKANNG